MARRQFVAGRGVGGLALAAFLQRGHRPESSADGMYALSAVASSVLFASLFNRSKGSVVPVPVLHTAVNAWSMIIPVMVLPDGGNLRPFQIVVGILVLTAVRLLCLGARMPNKVVSPA